MGRRPKLTPHQRQEAIKRRDRDEETLADIGRSYNVSPATISRLQLMDGFEFNPDVDENDAKARLAFAPRRTQDASAGAWTPTRSNRVVRKYAGALGLERCYSAHSMRAVGTSMFVLCSRIRQDRARLCRVFGRTLLWRKPLRRLPRPHLLYLPPGPERGPGSRGAAVRCCNQRNAQPRSLR